MHKLLSIMAPLRTAAYTRFNGQVPRHSDLEGGHVQLVGDDELDGRDPLLSKDGGRVEIDGAVDKAATSFAMTGPRLKVRTVKSL